MNQGMTFWGWIFFIGGWGAIIGLSAYCFGRVLWSKKKKDQLINDLGVPGRAQWASRVGLILAMAGNAVGLANFLRFPVKAAANGGGAFMIPYFCALIFLGVPLMWVEWTIGRYGGVHGHGTTPGMFSLMWQSRAAKYLGALGISLPFAILIYYVFIESWTLGYAWYSITGKYFGNTSRGAMNQFLKGYQGAEANQFFASLLPALIFLGITLLLNYFFLYRGISKGIELLAKVGMPILFVFGVLLVVRVLTMGTPNPVHSDWSVNTGLAYIWNPDFSRLTEVEVWLVAAGQVFFTLSLGLGIINTYASYLREKDDVTLNGLTTSSTNEFAEVVLGGTIAIPLAVAFFGLTATQAIAKEGSFNLGFVSLPVIFQQIPLGQVFGFMWFILLFIAGITSSVALSSPAVAFLEDEFKWKRSKAVNVVFAVVASATILVVAFFKYGFLDELDYWAGTFGLVIFAAIEIVIFSWIFGLKKGWDEMHHGADIKVPRVFKFVIKYITPIYILAMLGMWTYQEAIGKLLMKEQRVSPVVTVMKDNGEWRGQMAVIQSLALRDRAAVDGLITALESSSPKVQNLARQELKKVSGDDLGFEPKPWQLWWKENKKNLPQGDLKKQYRETVDSLLSLLNSENPDLRQGAKIALTVITGQAFEDDIASWKRWWQENREKLPLEKRPFLWGARALFLLVILLTLWMVSTAWKNRKEKEEYAQAVHDIEAI